MEDIKGFRDRYGNEQWDIVQSGYNHSLHSDLICIILNGRKRQGYDTVGDKDYVKAVRDERLWNTFRRQYKGI